MGNEHTPEYRMWRALFAVYDGIHELLLRRFLQGPNDISMKQHLVVKKVCDMMETTPQGIPLKDLASALHLTPGTVSELVENLVQKDVLQRVQNPEDRRAVMITVTQKSMGLLAEAEKKISGYVENIWKDFPDAEKQMLISKLEYMREKLELLESK